LRTAWTTAKLVLAVCGELLWMQAIWDKNVYNICNTYVRANKIYICKIYMCSGRKFVDARR